MGKRFRPNQGTTLRDELDLRGMPPWYIGRAGCSETKNGPKFSRDFSEHQLYKDLHQWQYSTVTLQITSDDELLT